METIHQAMIDTPSGARVPLSAIAEIREDRSPNFVTRENGQRKIVVSCNVAGRDLRSVVNDIQARIGNEVALPQECRVEYGGATVCRALVSPWGQLESEAEASRRILQLGGLVVLGILVILTTAFASWKDASSSCATCLWR